MIKCFIYIMVRNVSNIGRIPFSGIVTNPAAADGREDLPEYDIGELSHVTYDLGVKVPQKYTKIGEVTLSNGLVLHSYKLANGYRVSIIPMEDSPATVKNYVKVGSMNETDDIKGISHFLEHMAFNGTNGSNDYMKLGGSDSFRLVDVMGGWTNASTSYAKTDYVNQTPMLEGKDLDEQIRIMAAMTEDLALTDEMIEKEKDTVCSEINMILDDPQTVGIDQTVRSLFNVRSTADELVGGSTKHIMNLDRSKVKSYYDKYYTPDNMNLVITGDVNPDEVIEIVAREFRSDKISKGKKYDEKLIPIKNTVRKDFISDKTASAYVMLGFEGAPSIDAKQQIIGEIVASYLSSENVGLYRDLKAINTAGDFYTEKISSNPYSPTMNLYSLSCSEENTEKALGIVFNRISELRSPDEQSLKNIKEELLMEHKDAMEYSGYINRVVGCLTLDGNIDYLTKYEDILRGITVSDIDEYIEKYLNISKCALTVIHPDKTKPELNFKGVSGLSFNGKPRRPLNTDKIKETVLDNNYRACFYESNNDNINFTVTMKYEMPKDINPMALVVLNSIYRSGSAGETEEEFRRFKQDNNIYYDVTSGSFSASISGYTSLNNFDRCVKKAIDLYKNPKITEDEFEKAVSDLKDYYSRKVNTSWDLFNAYESQYDSSRHSAEEIIELADKLTIEDVRKAHEYIIDNAQGIITMNTPSGNAELMKRALNLFETLPKSKDYDYDLRKVYYETEAPVVLKEARNISQADISQTYKYRCNNDIKDKITVDIMNRLLSSSDSIGLFNSLREKDKLAYTVYSQNDTSGDCGTITLKIGTTTDNKDTGERSFDNIEKSIRGFHRQINLLRVSAYTDDDLESAKKVLKASILNNEGVENKLANISYSLTQKEGAEYYNRMYMMIDSITREDIDEMSARIFSKNPIYSVVASQDTLDFNREFLESLKG